MPKRKNSVRSRRGSQKRGPAKGLSGFLLKRFKLLVVSLSLVLGTIIVFGLVYFFQYFRGNFIQASSGSFLGSGDLDTSHDFNLFVFKIEDLKNPTSRITAAALLNFQVQKNKLQIFFLSPDENLSNPYAPGHLNLASMYGLSNLSSGDNNSRFSPEKTISLQLGLPIDGLVYTDEAEFKSLSSDAGINADFLSANHNFLGNLIQSSKILPKLGTRIKTNLGLKNLLSLSKFLIMSFPGDLESMAVKGIAENVEKYDGIFRTNSANQEILESRQTIIILNGTKTPGLATNTGRIASNLGLSALSSGNAPWSETNSQSFMIAKDPNSYAVQRLAKIFGIDDVREASTVENDPNFSRLLRADIILVAGLDQIK